MVDETDKALISLGVLVGAAILAVIIAKIVDIIYDRASISDDASDISEHTRNLIRARLTVMKFRNKKQEVIKTPIETEDEKKEAAVKVFRIWSAKSKLRTRTDAEKTGDTEAAMKLEDVSDTNKESRDATDVESGGKQGENNVKEDGVPDSVNKNPQTVTVISETKSEQIRPKSALKKPKPNDTTTTNTSGNTTTDPIAARPKSAVKRVTIAEPGTAGKQSPDTPEKPSAATNTVVQTEHTAPGTVYSNNDTGNSNRAETQSKSSVETVSQKESENDDESASTGKVSQVSVHLTEDKSDNGSRGDNSESNPTPLPETWKGQERDASSSRGESVRPGTKTGPSKRAAGWRETYAFYRGNSDDLLVPFNTKGKRKGKKKRKK